MEARSHILSASVARGIAIMCAPVFVASAHTAQAGINVWTSLEQPGGSVPALAIYENINLKGSSLLLGPNKPLPHLSARLE